MHEQGKPSVILYKVEITQEGSVTERRLGPGLVLVGGGLQADLVVPSLLDAELCELLLPATEGQPTKVTALVQGMVLNGREVRQQQTVSAMSHEIMVDNVTIRVSPIGAVAETITDKPTDRLVNWLDSSKTIFPERAAAVSTVSEYTRTNPAHVMFGIAALLGLLAFLVSGWPSAKFKPDFSPKAGTAAADRENVLSMLKEIKRRLSSADLGTPIKAEPSGSAVKLTGSADPAQAVRLDEIIRQVSTPGAAPIRNEVTMTSADAATGIEAVVTSPVSGVLVAGGRMVNEGQTIPTGWLVEKISPTQVTLKRDSVTHVIAMSEIVPPGADMAASARTASAAAKPAGGFQPVRSLQSISTPPTQPLSLPTLAPAPGMSSHGTPDHGAPAHHVTSHPRVISK